LLFARMPPFDPLKTLQMRWSHCLGWNYHPAGNLKLG
jgi:hypothetical protein